MSVQAKFAAFRTALHAGMVQREEESDMVLTALLCREHALVVSPPGEGKSMLLDAIMAWAKAPKFDVLLNKFSTPEEVLGPISVTSMKSDQYRRITDGMLPQASVAFLDEIFKASSAILNTTLKILNERKFRNGIETLDCPLLLCVAASNEWPSSSDGLGALFDRFLFRKTVGTINDERGIKRLLWDDSIGVKIADTISLPEINLACDQAEAMPWTPEAQDAMYDCVVGVRREGVHVGSRRIRKSVRAAQAFAFLDGADTVQPEHLEILSHVLWEDPSEQPKIVAKTIMQIANPGNAVVMQLLTECEQAVDGLDIKDAAATTVCIKKLSEIQTQLKGTKGTKATAALQYVSDKIKKIKLDLVAAF
jgi:MoxR-like ATPase